MDTSRALGHWARRLACCGVAVALLCTASSAAAGKPKKKPDLRISASVRCVNFRTHKQMFYRNVLAACRKGDQVEAEITVKNIGKKTSASVPWTLASSYGPFKKFGASPTSMIYPTPQAMKKGSYAGHVSQQPRKTARMVPKLKRNREFRQTVVLLRAGRVAAGKHSMKFTVDPDNKVIESNEKNNDRKITLTVKKPPKYVDRKVKLIDITKPIVPYKLYGGDREFDGNGPIIDCKVSLRVSKNKRAIIATITFKAKETKSDWSETRGSWTRTVYKKPKGRKIDKIFGPKVSKVHFKSKPGGFQVFGPTPRPLVFFLNKLNEIADAVDAVAQVGAVLSGPAGIAKKKLFDEVRKGVSALVQGNYVDVRAPKKGPVAVFAIVGDTGGDDISKDSNPHDDTRIQAIKFKRLKIRLK